MHTWWSHPSAPSKIVMHTPARRFASWASSDRFGLRAVASLVNLGNAGHGHSGELPSNGDYLHSRASSGSAASTTDANEGLKGDHQWGGKSLEEALVERGLEHVKFVGWSHEALHLAAQDLGLSKAASNVVPGGAASLILKFLSKSNAKALRVLEDEAPKMKSAPLAERLSRSLKVRLEMNKPVMDNMPQAAKLLAHPSHAPKAAKLLHDFVDEVWHINGDRSMDVSWYAKRAALCGIYTAAELHMLTDFSPGYQDTWDLVDARVKNLFEFQKLVKDGSSFIDMTYQMVKAELGKRLGFAANTG